MGKVLEKFWTTKGRKSLSGHADRRGPDGGDGGEVSDLPEHDRQTLQSLAVKLSPVRRVRYGLAHRLDRAYDSIRVALKQERAAGAGALWGTVAFGAGCAVYFHLLREPWWLAYPLVSVLALLGYRKLGSNGAGGAVLATVGLIAGGIAIAQLNTHLIDTPSLSRAVTAELTGLVTTVEQRPKQRVRYTIRLLSITGRGLSGSGAENLDRLRVTGRKRAKSISVGQRIKGRVRLSPTPGPAFPGAYDFSFHSWFAGIGASGYFLGQPEPLAQRGTLSGGSTVSINRLRQTIPGLIGDALLGQNGALAVALIVGDRSGIDTDTVDALRQAGLAHILAISGLHMALVVLTLMFVIRAVGAAIPRVVLNLPVKKIACVAGLFSATGYLFISGGSISTQRAFIMVVIMLVAVLLDRRALTMRNVALAVLLILSISPHAVLSPGFQMSFAAVAALVSCYEWLYRRRQAQQRQPRQPRNRRQPRQPRHTGLPPHDGGTGRMVLRNLYRGLLGMALTSLVAGLATALFAAFHFYRIAPFGLMANVLAMPVVTFAVMPLALLSVLLMPFGLESWALAAMEHPLQLVVSIAHLVSEIQPSGASGALPPSILLIGTLAIIIFTLTRTWLRTLSIPLFVMAIIGFGLKSTAPDLIVAESGRQIGVFTEKGHLNLLRPRAGRFTTNIWKMAFADGRAGSPTTSGPVKDANAFSCDRFGCSARVRNQVVLAVKSTARLFDDCRMADIIIIPYAIEAPCAGQVPAGEKRLMIIDARSLAQTGALSIWLDDGPRKSGNSGKNNNNNSSPASPWCVKHAHGQYPRPWTKHRKHQ